MKREKAETKPSLLGAYQEVRKEGCSRLCDGKVNARGENRIGCANLLSAACTHSLHAAYTNNYPLYLCHLRPLLFYFILQGHPFIYQLCFFFSYCSEGKECWAEFPPRNWYIGKRRLETHPAIIVIFCPVCRCPIYCSVFRDAFVYCFASLGGASSALENADEDEEEMTGVGRERETRETRIYAPCSSR